MCVLIIFDPAGAAAHVHGCCKIAADGHYEKGLRQQP